MDNEIRTHRGIDLLTGLDFALTEGTSMPYVPDYNITGAVDYLHPLSATVELKTRVSVTTLGPRSFDLFESITGVSDAHRFVNASIGAEAASWALSVFASNLFDEAAPESVALFNPLIRVRNQPRQVGVQASVRSDPAGGRERARNQRRHRSACPPPTTTRASRYPTRRRSAGTRSRW